MQGLGCWGDEFICICGSGILRGGTITHFIRNYAVQIRTLCLEAVHKYSMTLMSALPVIFCRNVATACVAGGNNRNKQLKA